MENIILKNNKWSTTESSSKEKAILQDFLHLISKGELSEIRNFLDKNENLNINFATEKGVIPLHFASFCAKQEIIELLISRGADLSLQDNLGKTPLDHALKKGDQKIIHYLIEQGATISKPNWDDPNVQIYFSNSDDFTEVTDVEGFMNVKGEDFKGVRDLNLDEIEESYIVSGELYDDDFKAYVKGGSNASDMDFQKVVINETTKVLKEDKTILNGNKKEDEDNDEKISGVTEKISSENIKVQGGKGDDLADDAKSIVHGEEENDNSINKVEGVTEHQKEDVNTVKGKIDEDDSIIHVKEGTSIEIEGEVIEVNEPEKMIKMAQTKNIRPEALFIVALKTKNSPVAFKLLDSGLDANSRDVKGYSFLMLALHYHCNDVATTLIEKGASIHYRSLDGKTALSSAVLENNIDGVELLIKSRVNLNVRIKQQTCLMYAVYKKYNEMAKKLLDGGIDIRAKDVRGNTALDYALQVKNEEMIKVLTPKK